VIYIGANFLGAMCANAPKENGSVGALQPEEFELQIPSTAVAHNLRSTTTYNTTTLHLCKLSCDICAEAFSFRGILSRVP